ncbi:MAG: dienelactone hydrolase family protein [Alphaproteobacteria bacterium]
MTTPPPDLDGYEPPTRFAHDGIEHWVYRRGQGPAVVVMHELPGLTPACLRFLDRLVEAGYRVVVPLLFGKPGRFDLPGNFVRICIANEINLFARHATHPLTAWLRALCRATHEETGGDGIGLIGMCLTGNFVLALVTEPGIVAPVAAQPSLPVFGPAALSMSDAELAASKAAVAARGPGHVIGFRYSHDVLCRPAKFARLRAEYGGGFDGMELDGAKHATLTDHQSPVALAKTLDFLGERLRPA